MRAQGRKTMRRLLDAGMRVFADRGFHAARVDDIVRAARTSHGTFYLYFTNKEDLLRALATECGHEMSALADTLGPVGPDGDRCIELAAGVERGRLRRRAREVRAVRDLQLVQKRVADQREPVGPEHDTHAHPRYAGLIVGSKTVWRATACRHGPGRGGA